MMDKAKIRRLVFEVLRRESQTHLNSVEYQVRELAKEYQRHDALKLQEIIWELLVQGVLAPGKNSLNLNLPFFHVTEYGEECLETDAILLHDPDGYIRHLQEVVSSPIDETVLAYVRESQLSFLAGRYLGTVVLLGIAAERCLDLLTTAYLETLPEAERRTPSGFTEIREHLLTLPFPEELKRDLDLRLNELNTLIRYSRDKTGRAVVSDVDRATAHAHLLLFPQECRTAYRLLARLSTKRSNDGES
jgi:hypothetical protein